jgi:hypothetical protein
LTCGQRKTERIGLIVKIENDLSGHVYFSPWMISLLHRSMAGKIDRAERAFSTKMIATLSPFSETVT